MTVDWNGYQVYEPAVPGSPSELSRRDARRVFEFSMTTRPARVEELRRLLAAHGVHLGSSDEDIQALNDWFVSKVEEAPDHHGLIHPTWHSVIHDIAMFLGDVMIERHPHLQWEFFTWGKSNAAFQRAVLMGFGTEDPKFHTNFDVESALTTLAHRVFSARGSYQEVGTVEVRGVAVDVDRVARRHRYDGVEPDVFLEWLRVVARRA